MSERHEHEYTVWSDAAIPVATGVGEATALELIDQDSVQRYAECDECGHILEPEDDDE